MAKIRGTKDDDFLIGTGSFDQIYGRGGSDEIAGSLGDDQLYGGTGADSITGSVANELIQGGAGNDQISFGNAGTSFLYGGSGSDSFVAPATYGGTNNIDGGSGADILVFTNVPTPVVVDLGAGTVEGGNEGGGATTHFVNVERAEGTFFNDILVGDGADNLFSGGFGNDTLSGGDGNDTLVGHRGDDVITGGNGADTFIWVNAVFFDNHGTDVITDFLSGEDKLSIVADLSIRPAGSDGNFGVDDARFYSAAGATSGNDETDRVIYDTTSGNVYLDFDGNGARQAMLMFTLVNAPVLQATDITLQVI